MTAPDSWPVACKVMVHESTTQIDGSLVHGYVAVPLKETWEPLIDAVPQSPLATAHPGSAHSAVNVTVPVSVWPIGAAGLPLLSVTVLTNAKLPARGFTGTIRAAADAVPTGSAADPVNDMEVIVESPAVAEPEAAPVVPVETTVEPPPVLFTAPVDAGADATAP